MSPWYIFSFVYKTDAEYLYCTKNCTGCYSNNEVLRAYKVLSFDVRNHAKGHAFPTSTVNKHFVSKI